MNVAKGELVKGKILRQAGDAYVVGLDMTEAVLPYSEQIPGEALQEGDEIKAYVLEVRLPDSKVILSRAHPSFITKLFESEVPEIGLKLMEVKAVARNPGDRTKIIVQSRDRTIDPVKACVGMNGHRIQAVVRELRHEKIDIIEWSPNPRILVAEALNPAIIKMIIVDEGKKSALVVVPDDQLSLAFGQNGQNIELAAKLTGWKIDIISSSEYDSKT